MSAPSYPYHNSMQVNYPIADTAPAAAMSLSNLFIDVSTLPADGYGFFQLLTLGGVYGYILFNASNLISDGSELLLLVPTLAGLVGYESSNLILAYSIKKNV